MVVKIPLTRDIWEALESGLPANWLATADASLIGSYSDGGSEEGENSGAPEKTYLINHAEVRRMRTT